MKRPLETIVKDIEAFRNLSLQEQVVWWALLAGHSSHDIGKMLKLEEEKIGEIKSGLFTYLKDML